MENPIAASIEFINHTVSCAEDPLAIICEHVGILRADFKQVVTSVHNQSADVSNRLERYQTEFQVLRQNVFADMEGLKETVRKQQILIMKLQRMLYHQGKQQLEEMEKCMKCGDEDIPDAGTPWKQEQEKGSAVEKSDQEEAGVKSSAQKSESDFSNDYTNDQVPKTIKRDQSDSESGQDIKSLMCPTLMGLPNAVLSERATENNQDFTKTQRPTCPKPTVKPSVSHGKLLKLQTGTTLLTTVLPLEAKDEHIKHIAFDNQSIHDTSSYNDYDEQLSFANFDWMESGKKADLEIFGINSIKKCETEYLGRNETPKVISDDGMHEQTEVARICGRNHKPMNPTSAAEQIPTEKKVQIDDEKNDDTQQMMGTNLEVFCPHIPQFCKSGLVSQFEEIYQGNTMYRISQNSSTYSTLAHDLKEIGLS